MKSINTHTHTQQDESIPSSSKNASAHSACPDVEIIKNDFEETLLRLETRIYHIRGLAANLEKRTLKVNVSIKSTSGNYVADVDLYNIRHRRCFSKEAARQCQSREIQLETEIIHIINFLEATMDQWRHQEKDTRRGDMSPPEYDAAMAFLNDPNLIDRIMKDFEACGFIGEKNNLLAGYLGATSRKLRRPLGMIIQALSAAGKTSLMEAVLRLMPEEDVIQVTDLTKQALYYMGEDGMQNKILAICESGGAKKASFALKQLQSDGGISIAAPEHRGAGLATRTRRVPGPVALFTTTTMVEIDEELENRCLKLTVDDSSRQTAAIQEYQRKMRTYEGLKMENSSKAIQLLHQNAQRLLHQCIVVNPYAEDLKFQSTEVRNRRDQEKYLTLIESIALLHQYQRVQGVVKIGDTEYRTIEVSIDDIEIAHMIAYSVFGQSLDELSPPLRNIYDAAEALAIKKSIDDKRPLNDIWFTRYELHDTCKKSLSQIHTHITRLEKEGYLLKRAGLIDRHQQEYRLVYINDKATGHRRMLDLADVRELRRKYESKKSDSKTYNHAPTGDSSVVTQTVNDTKKRVKAKASPDTTRGERGTKTVNPEKTSQEVSSNQKQLTLFGEVAT